MGEEEFKLKMAKLKKAVEERDAIIETLANEGVMRQLKSSKKNARRSRVMKTEESPWITSSNS
jgi:hypothetical protein